MKGSDTAICKGAGTALWMGMVQLANRDSQKSFFFYALLILSHFYLRLAILRNTALGRPSRTTPRAHTDLNAQLYDVPAKSRASFLRRRIHWQPFDVTVA